MNDIQGKVSMILSLKEYEPYLSLLCVFWKPTEVPVTPCIPHCLGGNAQRAANVHVAICSLFGGSVVPLLIHSLLGSPPSCVASSLIIHDSHRFLSSSFSGLAALSSTGWHRLVHPPGICGTQLIDLCYN